MAAPERGPTEPRPWALPPSDPARVRSCCHPTHDAAGHTPSAGGSSSSTARPGGGGGGGGAAPRAAGPHELHQAVWLAERRRIEALLDSGCDINEADGHGATPLMLAVQLLPRARAYRGVLELLLERGADARARSALGWSPLDEAVSRGDEALARALLESAQRTLRRRWEARLASAARSLRELPDFECRIRWEFESPIVPLMNKIAPSDVVRIRKRGLSMRLDSTLASWKRFRFSKRRDLTTLLQGGQPGTETIAAGDGGGSGGVRFCMLNHDKQTAVDMTAGLDAEEAGAIVKDLVAAEAMQCDVNIDSLEISEGTSWLGSAVGPCEVNGWKALRFDVRGTMGVVVQKKGDLGNRMTFQEYFGCPLPLDACLPELREEFSAALAGPAGGAAREAEHAAGLWGELQDDDVPSSSSEAEVLAEWPAAAPASGLHSDSRECAAADEAAFGAARAAAGAGERESGPVSSAGAGRPRGVGDQTGRTSGRFSASVWLATDFAISLEQFLPVLDTLAVEHAAMRRLRELLASDHFTEAAASAARATGRVAEEKKDAASRPLRSGSGGTNVFPVRASVPVNLALRALVHFEQFELRPEGSLEDELFEVPEGYRWAARSEAQKTPGRARKRMLLANLAM